MKKMLCFSLLFLVLLTGCQSKDITKQTASSESLPVLGAKSSINQDTNDLVFHDYGTAIDLTKNSKLTTSPLNLDLKEETAKIYAVDLEHGTMDFLSDYTPNLIVNFSTDTAGRYQIIAVLSDDTTIDLTPNVSNIEFETTYYLEDETKEEINGLLPLD